jgi:hypothetical protein
MKKKKKKGLTEKRASMTLRQVQAELDSISVEPNVEERLDRIFERVGLLYGGNYRAFFEDLAAANTETLRECDLRVPHEISSCRLDDE